ncbi:unnamed protein product, partial [Didymodactylos carnosus]
VNTRLTETKPFADITDLAVIPQEAEILFMAGSVFQIKSVREDADNRLWIITLVLCSDQDNTLQDVFNSLRQKICGEYLNFISLGNILKEMGKLDQAEQCYRKYLRKVKKDDCNFGRCYGCLGQVAHERGDNKEALSLLSRALEIEQKNPNKDEVLVSVIHNNIGNVHCATNDYRSALECYTQSLENLRSNATEDNRMLLADTYGNLGNTYCHLKQHDEALSYYNQCLSIQQVLSPSDPRTGTTLMDRAQLYSDTHRYDEALNEFQKALVIQQISLPADHEEIGKTHYNIGRVYELSSKYRHALESFEKAFNIYRRTIGERHSSSSRVQVAIERVQRHLVPT